MSWMAVAVGTSAAVSAYGIYQSDKQMQAQLDAAGSAQERQMILAQQQMAFEREQYDRWQETYGSVEDNLSEFYDNLSSDDLAATQLHQQKQAFDQTREEFQKTAARTDLSDPAKAQIETGLDLEEARGSAAIRANAPMQLAQAQQGFVSGGRGNPMAGGVSNAYGNISGAYGNQYNSAMQQYGIASQNQAAGYQGLGQSLSSGAYLAAYGDKSKTPPPGTQPTTAPQQTDARYDPTLAPAGGYQ